MKFGRFFSLFRAPETNEEIKRLEAEREQLEADMMEKYDAANEELDDLIRHTLDVRAIAQKKSKMLNETMKSISSSPPTDSDPPVKPVPTLDIRGKLSSEPDAEPA